MNEQQHWTHNLLGCCHFIWTIFSCAALKIICFKTEVAYIVEALCCFSVILAYTGWLQVSAPELAQFMAIDKLASSIFLAGIATTITLLYIMSEAAIAARREHPLVVHYACLSLIFSVVEFKRPSLRTLTARNLYVFFSFWFLSHVLVAQRALEHKHDEAMATTTASFNHL